MAQRLEYEISRLEQYKVRRIKLDALVEQEKTLNFARGRITAIIGLAVLTRFWYNNVRGQDLIVVFSIAYAFDFGWRVLQHRWVARHLKMIDAMVPEPEKP